MDEMRNCACLVVNPQPHIGNSHVGGVGRQGVSRDLREIDMSNDTLDVVSSLVDLQQVSLAAKMGEGQKARETRNTWHAH